MRRLSEGKDENDNFITSTPKNETLIAIKNMENDEFNEFEITPRRYRKPRQVKNWSKDGKYIGSKKVKSKKNAVEITSISVLNGQVKELPKDQAKPKDPNDDTCKLLPDIKFGKLEEIYKPKVIKKLLKNNSIIRFSKK